MYETMAQIVYYYKQTIIIFPPSYNKIIVNYNVQIQSKHVLHEEVSYSYLQSNTIPFQLVCKDFTT